MDIFSLAVGYLFGKNDSEDDYILCNDCHIKIYHDENFCAKCGKSVDYSKKEKKKIEKTVDTDDDDFI